MMTAYFFKEKPDEYQIHPVPDNLDDYIQVVVKDESELYGKRWDSTTSTLQPSITLIDIINSKKNEVNAWRLQQEISGVNYGASVWDTDPASRQRIQSVLLSGVMPLDYWTNASNEDQTMTLAALRTLYAAIVQQDSRIHARQRQMKAEVNALTTIEEVQAYPVGWPAEAPA